MALKLVTKSEETTKKTRARLKDIFGYIAERRDVSSAKPVLVLLGDLQKIYYMCKEGDTLNVDYVYQVSTGSQGFSSCAFEPNKTPLGMHVIYEKDGSGLPLGTLMEARMPTQHIAPISTEFGVPAMASVTTRVLVLAGREVRNYDTLYNQVYIHGTPREYSMGFPDSGACIRMRNLGVAELFDLVPEGTPLYIDPGSRKW